MTRAYNTATTQQNSGGAVAGMTAGKNVFLNGAMQIWQRGISFAATTGTTTAYSADRWTWWGGNSATLATRQTTSDTTNLPNIQYCARIARPSGNTGTSATYFGQAVETINAIPLAGKTVTVSYYARAGANMSNSAQLQPVLVSGTGTDQNYIHSAWTGFSIVAAGTVNLTTTWTRYSFTGVVPTNCTELTFQSYWIPTGTAGAADYYEITGIQLEVGSVATPFQTATGTVEGELAACQRYYYRLTSTDDVFSRFASGIATVTNAAEFLFSFPVQMRVKPSLLDISATSTFSLWDGANDNAVTTNFGMSRQSVNNASVGFGTAATMTQYRPYVAISKNTTTAFIGFIAEI